MIQHKLSMNNMNLKMLLVLSVIPMVLIVGGVDLAYAQEEEGELQAVWLTEYLSYPVQTVLDYTLISACTVQNQIYAQGSGFASDELISIYFTPYPANGNDDGQYIADAPGYRVINFPFNDMSYDHLPTNIRTDDDGTFTGKLIDTNPLQPGTYNVIAHVFDDTLIFDTDYDAIDIIDGYGLEVISCVQEFGVVVLRLHTLLNYALACNGGAGLLSEDSETCTIPSTGDWIVSQSCTVLSDVTVNNGNLLVQNNSVLTIDYNSSVDVDLVNHSINVESGSGILVKSGSKIN